MFATNVGDGLRRIRLFELVSLASLCGTIVNFGSQSRDHALIYRNALGSLRLTAIQVLSYTKCRSTAYELFLLWATMISNVFCHGGVLTAQRDEGSTSCISK